MHSILITGIGGTRSIAVLKALRMTGKKYRLIGTDANYFNPGSFQCDASYIVPFASDPNYLPQLEEIIVHEKVKVIFATVEKEVAYLATQKQYLEDKHKVRVVVPDSSILDVCFDKYKTQEFLLSHGFTAIPCIYAGERTEIESFVKKHSFPLIRKPVFGYGSKGLSIIHNQSELDTIELDNNYVLQKFIQNSNNESFYNIELNEFTAEIFIHQDKSIAGGIVMKRALRNGETVAGYLVKDQETVDYLGKIALATRIKGPVNFQFRIHDGKVYIFEINPLYSGTTAIRARLGFNSVGMAAEAALANRFETVTQDELKQEYFMRYLDEVFINPKDLKCLKEEHFVTYDS